VLRHAPELRCHRHPTLRPRCWCQPFQCQKSGTKSHILTANFVCTCSLHFTPSVVGTGSDAWERHSNAKINS
jgi:hypothetical protein